MLIFEILTIRIFLISIRIFVISLIPVGTPGIPFSATKTPMNC